MRRKRFGISLAAIVCSAPIFGVWQGVAGARTAISVSWTIRGTYTCFDQCATTSASGTAHSDSRILGTMSWTNEGAGDTAAVVCPRNLAGVTVSEDWVFTTRDGDQLDLATTSDDLCFVSTQVATENATFEITGGTGRFSKATGTGTFEITDLTSPSNEMGKFNATIDGST